MRFNDLLEAFREQADNQIINLAAIYNIGRMEMALKNWLEFCIQYNEGRRF